MGKYLTKATWSRGLAMEAESNMDRVDQLKTDLTMIRSRRPGRSAGEREAFVEWKKEKEFCEAEIRRLDARNDAIENALIAGWSPGAMDMVSLDTLPAHLARLAWGTQRHLHSHPFWDRSGMQTPPPLSAREQETQPHSERKCVVCQKQYFGPMHYSRCALCYQSRAGGNPLRSDAGKRKRDWELDPHFLDE